MFAFEIGGLDTRDGEAGVDIHRCEPVRRTARIFGPFKHKICWPFLRMRSSQFSALTEKKIKNSKISPAVSEKTRKSYRIFLIHLCINGYPFSLVSKNFLKPKVHSNL